MSTTTLRIDSPLRQRILDLAQATGQSAHSFMIEALAQKTQEAEWQLALQKDAAQRAEQMLTNQAGLDWHDVREWMLAKATGMTTGKEVHAPQVKSLDEIKAAQTTAMQTT